MTPAKVRAQEDTRRATEARGVLTPVEAHRDKIHKRMDIEVVFIRSIIDYRIYGETCECYRTASLSRDRNQGLRYELKRFLWL